MPTNKKEMKKETYCAKCLRTSKVVDQIKTDLLKIANEGEYEDMRREVEKYFAEENKKCICDKAGLNEETRADIGHFIKCPQAETYRNNQIIKDTPIDNLKKTAEEQVKSSIRTSFEKEYQTSLEKAYQLGRDQAVVVEIEEFRARGRIEALKEVEDILTDEIATAHTTEAGKTSRLTSAFMRIKGLKGESFCAYE